MDGIPHHFSSKVSTAFSFLNRGPWRGTVGGRVLLQFPANTWWVSRVRTKVCCGVLSQPYAQSSWTHGDLAAPAWQWFSHGHLDMETGIPKASCPSQCPPATRRFPLSLTLSASPCLGLEDGSNLSSHCRLGLTQTNQQISLLPKGLNYAFCNEVCTPALSFLG